MEIRLIVNGNLVHTMSMPKLQLISSKNDIFFATTAPEFFPNRTDRLFVDRQQELQKLSPPSSPNGKKINCCKAQKATATVLKETFKAHHEILHFRMIYILFNQIILGPFVLFLLGSIVIQGVTKLMYSKSGVL
jgi:hypothetical protein